MRTERHWLDVQATPEPNPACQLRSTRDSGACSAKARAGHHTSHAGPVVDTAASGPTDPRRNRQIASRPAATDPVEEGSRKTACPFPGKRRQPARPASRCPAWYVSTRRFRSFRPDRAAAIPALRSRWRRRRPASVSGSSSTSYDGGRVAVRAWLRTRAACPSCGSTCPRQAVADHDRLPFALRRRSELFIRIRHLATHHRAAGGHSMVRARITSHLPVKITGTNLQRDLARCGRALEPRSQRGAKFLGGRTHPASPSAANSTRRHMGTACGKRKAQRSGGTGRIPPIASWSLGQRFRMLPTEARSHPSLLSRLWDRRRRDGPIRLAPSPAPGTSNGRFACFRSVNATEAKERP